MSEQFNYIDRRNAGQLIKERDDLLRQLPPGTGEQMDQELQGVSGAARHAREVSFLMRRLNP